MSRYVFSTVRVVPNLATGEFANIAAIAGSDDTGEWMVRQLVDESRVRRFCGVDATRAAHDFLTRLGDQLDMAESLREEDGVSELGASEEPSESWLVNLAGMRRHVVQLSDPQPVLADSIDSAFDKFFPHVTVAAEEVRSRGLTKWRAVSDLYKSYRAAHVDDDHLFRRLTLTAAGRRPYSAPVDFVVANGVGLQVTHAWSFQAADQSHLSRDVKAWGWTMREVREHGGVALNDKRRVSVPASISIEAVVIPPSPGKSSAVFDEARNVFEELGVSYLNHGSETVIADRAAKLLTPTHLDV